MPRKAPPERFEPLVDVATRVFIDGGYQRTQMADVADAMGVAKGTLYLYVESKEALFDLAVRLADAPRPLRAPENLPLRTPRAGATATYVASELAKSPVLALLDSFLTKKRRGDARFELEMFVRELYEELSRHRRALKLVDQSAKDLPDLAAVWFDTARGGLIDQLTRYLDDRIGARLLRRVPDTRAAARVIIETTVFWAVHRHWDSHPQAVDESKSKETVVHFTVGALAKEKE